MSSSPVPKPVPAAAPAKPLVEGQSPKTSGPTIPTKTAASPSDSSTVSQDAQTQANTSIIQDPAAQAGKGKSAEAENKQDKPTANQLTGGDASQGVWDKAKQWIKDHPALSIGLAVLGGMAIAGAAAAAPLVVERQ